MTIGGKPAKIKEYACEGCYHLCTVSHYSTDSKAPVCKCGRVMVEV